jgi:hypothetical protein
MLLDVDPRLVAQANWKREGAGPSNVPEELAVTVRRSTVQRSYHLHPQTVPRARLDSSKGVHGTEETMAAAPKDVMDGWLARRPEVEASPVERVAYDYWLEPALLLPERGDSRWHEPQLGVMTRTLMAAPRVHMDAMTEVESEVVVDVMYCGW